MNTSLKHTLSLAALLACSTSAFADFSYTDGDLLLCFRKAGNSDVVIDLGSASTYLASSQSGLSVSYSDVAGSFGGSLSGVTWSLIGYNDSDNAKLWSTSAGTALVPNDYNSQATIGGSVVYTLGSTAAGNYGSSSSLSQVAVVPTSDAASYTTLVKGSSGANYDYFTQNVEMTGTGTMNVYGLTSGAASGDLLGTFTVGDNSIQYSVFSPVPEASSYGMAAAGAMLAILTFNAKRRNQATL